MLPVTRVIPPGPTWTVDDFAGVLDGNREPWFGTVSVNQPYPAGAGIRVLTDEGQGTGYADFLRLREDCVCAIHDRQMPHEPICKSDHGGWLGITVRLSGASCHVIGGVEEIHRSERSCAIVYYPRGVGTCEWFQPHERLLSLSVLMRPSFLLSSFNLDAGDLPPLWRRLFDGERDLPALALAMPFPSYLEPMLRRVLDDSSFEPVRYLEIQAIGTLLGCFAANGLRSYCEREFPPALLTPAEEARIRDLRTQLLADLSKNSSLLQLARRAGMNRTKLQAGFKCLFGETLFDCLERHRMELAMTCLRQQQVPIYEIAQRTGYQHARNFSVAFHRYYGVLPRAVH